MKNNNEKSKIEKYLIELESIFCFLILFSSVLFLKYSNDMEVSLKLVKDFNQELKFVENLKQVELKKYIQNKFDKDNIINAFNKNNLIINDEYINNQLTIKISKKINKKDCIILKNNFFNSNKITFNNKKCLLSKKIIHTIEVKQND
jgi:hypothetical protein